ncbi:MAG TPA: slipin family protein [Thermoanaerobaculaceae bacterium]|nr:slipin family protein [Thermoanaerobaculaceae bacterium]
MSPFVGFPNITITRRQKDEGANPSGSAQGSRHHRPGRCRQVSGPAAWAAAIVWAAGVGATAAITGSTGREDLVPFILVPTFLVGLYLLFAIRVASQWERAVILRLGKFRGLKGPGLYWIVPVLDVVTHVVDQRVRATDVSAESALTRDTVPVNVDAIIFWLVWDAEKSVLEVQSYFDAIFLSAQTALREAIGRHDLAEMITEREKLGQELQRILDEKTNPWGITVQSVEIRDVRIPSELEDAMSRRAQAERERQARIILGTAETEIAQLFAKASELYRTNPTAMHLRAMNMLYEAIKEKGSMVIVPSSAVETMGLGGMLGTTALGGVGAAPPAPPPGA